jgi:type IV fimbrial biogenesis protein FimT
MLITVAVAAVLMGIGIPSMKSIIDSMRLTSVSNDFLSHLVLARSEAIKRNSRVVLCKSADGASCASAGGWEQGWIVFHDVNDNGVLDAGEAVIARQQVLAGGLRVTGNQTVAQYVSFAPSGATKLVGGGFQAGTVTLCRHSAFRNEARQIVLNAVGRPRVQKVEVDQCN